MKFQDRNLRKQLILGCILLMSLMACRTLTSVIDKLVHRLCLESFPCGKRSWHKPTLRGSEAWHEDENTDAQLEESDMLHDLLRCPRSPWHEEASWSPQALALRELAVRAPEKLYPDFIRSSFTTLRIVDKRVTVIDEGLLMFRHLEELILTVNNVSEVPAKNLPNTLKVLELYGNQISSLKSLHIDLPPHLLHLGLGNNLLGSPKDLQYFTANLWPQLMSLDLSWSDYLEQYALVDALSRLPRLRSLVLEGNPLTLTTLYPGFTLDSLVYLLYLDGNRVTPYDREQFSGLAQLGASASEEAEVIVCVETMKGVPNPTLMLADGAVSFPLVSYSYSVSYEFLDEAQSQKIQAEGKSSENIPQNPQVNQSATPTPRTSSYQQKHAFSIPVTMHWTTKKEWAEIIEFDYAQTHRIRDLAALKSFILCGLHLIVEEQKVLSWPALPAESTKIKASAKKKDKEATIAGAKLKDKETKKDPDLKLIHDPPIRRTLGSVYVNLEDLLLGKDHIEEACDLGVQDSDHATIRTAATQEKGESKKSQEEQREDKILKLKSTKGKEKGCSDIEPDALDDESNSSKMEPLTVEFSVRLNKWTSDSEGFKTRQNRQFVIA